MKEKSERTRKHEMSNEKRQERENRRKLKPCNEVTTGKTMQEKEKYDTALVREAKRGAEKGKSNEEKGKSTGNAKKASDIELISDSGKNAKEQARKKSNTRNKGTESNKRNRQG